MLFHGFTSEYFIIVWNKFPPIHSGGGLFLGMLLAESLSIFHDLAMGETAATEAKRRWNAEGAGMPPLPNHWKNKGRRHQREENKAIP